MPSVLGTAELGHLALALALGVALVQSVLPLVGAGIGHRPWMRLGPAAATAQFALVAIAFAAALYAFITSDFSLTLVADNSHSAKPLIYKITGLWANHEGSMLLWVLILALFGALVASFGGGLPEALKARVLAIQGMIGVGFLAFILFTSNPFLRLASPPLDGRGMNPLLQDPGIALHPPFLYLGYVGFSVTFSFAVAALIEGRVDQSWARWVRPWTLLAWTTLTAGIGLGSWWAYYELGWGGWWFWDPVENASFMPWLAGTALLHSAIVVEKRDALKKWTVLLAILCFSLSLVGTFLVRSGILSSVHAFAQDPERGVYILAFLIVVIGGSLALYAWRAPMMEASASFPPISREGALLLNNLFLAAATGVVFVGTLYPLFLDVLAGTKVTVGPPYFEATFVPMMVPLLMAVGIGVFLPWRKGDLKAALHRLRLAFLAAFIAFIATLAMTDWQAALAGFGMALATWLIAATLLEWAERVKLFRAPASESWRRAGNLPRSAYGMSLAHAGLAILVAGATASSAWTVESIQAQSVGETVTVAGRQWTLESVEEQRGPNYVAERATVRMERPGRAPVVFHPERRLYPVERQTTTEASIRSGALGDSYVTLGEATEDGRWVTRYSINPLIPWLWTGVLAMVIGGAVSLTDRRQRAGMGRRPAADSPVSGAAAAGAE